MKQEPIGTIELLYEDSELLVVSKPNRMLVHRSSMDYYEDRNLLRELSASRSERLHPAHRLDKATSGVIVFAKSNAALSFLREEFNARRVEKHYLAVVRGYTPAQGTIDRPLLAEGDHKEREALTRYTTLKHVEVEMRVTRYPQSRYSLVRIYPETGRYHQIRMHFDKIRHPIIGDSRHGDRKHNAIFREKLGLEPLFLHAEQLRFAHPNGGQITVSATLPQHFSALLTRWDWVDGASALAVEPGNHRK